MNWTHGTLRRMIGHLARHDMPLQPARLAARRHAERTRHRAVAF